MVKRFLSFFMVFVFGFMGVFGLSASASALSIAEIIITTGQVLFDLLAADGVPIGTYSGDFPERIKEAVSDEDAFLYDPTFSITASNGKEGYWIYDRSCITSTCADQKLINIDDYYIFCVGSYILSTPVDLNRNLGTVYAYCVPKEYKDNITVDYTEESGRWRISSNGAAVPYIYLGYTLMYKSGQPYYNVYYFNDYRSGTKVLSFSLSPSSSSGVKCCFNDFGLQDELQFTSSISLDSSADGHKIVNIHLDSNIPVPHDLVGMAGIMYDDGVDSGFVNSEYISTTQLQGEQHWLFTFDYNDFAYWVTRKRLSRDNYYGVVSVLSGSSGTHIDHLVIYSNMKPLDLPDPSGIFSDVEEIPPFDPPDPSPSPLFPDISFDYSPTNNYYTYNTENIENYDFSQNGDDFGSFFQWFNGAFGTFNANFNGLIDAFNGNLKLFSDNMIDFTTALGDFITGGFADISAYFGSLVDKIDVDFTNEINAFGDYFGDVMDLINHNVAVIIDNISANIELMFKPDEDYLDHVLLECCPWYYQVRNVITDVKNNMSESDSVSVHIQIPPLDYDENVEFKDDDTALLFRRTLSVILVAGTVLGCVRLGFQIFGINIRDGQGVE